MSETTPSAPFKTAPCPATWDLIEQLAQLESSKNRLHLEYMGKAMPAEVYLRFQNLRDERIPALRSQLRVDPAAASDQPPAHFAHAYADQLMLRCLLPDKSASQAQPADELDAEIAKLKKAYQELGSMFHDQIVAQQAAWIEWQHGAEAGMQWIKNGLCGPGHIPDEDEPYRTEAQAYFDANKSDLFPACYCGRPSNILWMGKGFCSDSHHDEHRAAMAAAQEGGRAVKSKKVENATDDLSQQLPS